LAWNSTDSYLANESRGSRRCSLTVVEKSPLLPDSSMDSVVTSTALRTRLAGPSISAVWGTSSEDASSYPVSR